MVQTEFVFPAPRLQEATVASMREHLDKMCGPKTKARELGYMFLAAPGHSLTTAEIFSRFQGRCSSIMERLRCDLRGRLGWWFEVSPIQGQASHRYTLIIKEGL